MRAALNLSKPIYYGNCTRQRMEGHCIRNPEKLKNPIPTHVTGMCVKVLFQVRTQKQS